MFGGEDTVKNVLLAMKTFLSGISANHDLLFGQLVNGITALEYFDLSKLSLLQPSDPELSVISGLFNHFLPVISGSYLTVALDARLLKCILTIWIRMNIMSVSFLIAQYRWSIEC